MALAFNYEVIQVGFCKQLNVLPVESNSAYSWKCPASTCAHTLIYRSRLLANVILPAMATLNEELTQ